MPSRASHARTLRAADPGTWVLRALVLLAACVAARYAAIRSIQVDEMEAIHSAWKVLRGQHAYTGFFQHHHPLLYYLLAPVIGLVGESSAAVLACRAVVFAMAVGSVWAVHRIAALVFGARAALVATALCATAFVFVDKAVEVRPDVPQTLFGTLAIGSFLRHARDRRMRHMVGAGLALGVSFLFLQKAAMLAAIFAVVSAARLAGGRVTWRELGVGALAAAAPVAALILPLAIAGELETYLILNWKVNAIAEGGFGPLPLLLENARYSTVLWVFFAVGLVAGPRSRAQLELGVFALGLLGTVLVAPRPWLQYHLPAMLPMAVLAGHGVVRTFERRPSLAAALVVLGALPGLNALTRWVPRNDAQLARVDAVHGLVPPGACVYDGRGAFNLFRDDLDWFWFNTCPKGCLDRYRRFRAYEYDVEALILEKRPALISSYLIDPTAEPYAGLYVPSNLGPGLFELRGDAGAVASR